MANRPYRRSILVGAAVALCCTGVTGAADPWSSRVDMAPVSGPALHGQQHTGPPWPMTENVPHTWGTAEKAPRFWAEAEKAVVRLVNKERSTAGCGSLSVDGRLARAAREHSRDMARISTLSHRGSDGRSSQSRAAAAGYENWAGEVIASGYESAEQTVREWMRSPGHRSVLLNCSTKHTGVGVVKSEGGPYWVQTFGHGD